MSIIKRLSNLAKGSLAAADSERGSGALDALLQEQALEQELARPPAPSEAARETLRELKAAQGSAAKPAPAALASSDPLARLEKAFEDGILTKDEYDRKAAEVVAARNAAGDDPAPVEPEVKRTL